MREAARAGETAQVLQAWAKRWTSRREGQRICVCSQHVLGQVIECSLALVFPSE